MAFSFFFSDFLLHVILSIPTSILVSMFMLQLLFFPLFPPVELPLLQFIQLLKRIIRLFLVKLLICIKLNILLKPKVWRSRFESCYFCVQSWCVKDIERSSVWMQMSLDHATKINRCQIDGYPPITSPTPLVNSPTQAFCYPIFLN